MAKFTVDTHLFRELGALLVGRDSTALVELIKNAYDADATNVTVTGENLGSKKEGRIVIADNGIGMTPAIFERGFLRIASRIKEEGDRRSPFYGRRFTGAKGIGRLAAQKLAWNLYVLSAPDADVVPNANKGVEASIDWQLIEKYETLDDARIEKAIRVDSIQASGQPGTEIYLSKLRSKWSTRDRLRVIQEVSTFQPQSVLIDIPEGTTKHRLLFEQPVVRDIEEGDDPGFEVTLAGDFDVGEEYWNVVAKASDWILEVDSDGDEQTIDYLITPCRSFLKQFPQAEQQRFTWTESNLEYIPTFTARILIRDGMKVEFAKADRQQWVTKSAGVRIYMEGFRVLPYGDGTDDWLEIDRDYTQRQRRLRFLSEANLDLSKFADQDDDYALTARRNSAYFGAVFLTNNGARELSMLVNREGFVPNAQFLSLQTILRVGIDLSVRVRAFETQEQRKDWKDARSARRIESVKEERWSIRRASETSIKNALQFSREAREAQSVGNSDQAIELIESASQEVKTGLELANELVTDRPIMQILSGIGLQMAAFVHEINGLLGMASALESAVDSIRESETSITSKSRGKLARLSRGLGDLRRIIERLSSYLADVASPDARRRRSVSRLEIDLGQRLT